MKNQNPKIVCIGGGTGLSTMLRGLKSYTEELTAIVTVADNGGGSGVLRREMNMLPPGDIRNCLLALAETEPLLENIFRYRFKEGRLAGQNLGNLLLAALNDMYGSFELAIEKATEVLAVKGTVLPVTTDNVELCATYADGSEIVGEHEIVFVNKVERKRITGVRLIPDKPKPYFKAIDAINEAECIVLGPGSLYTSIIPNLLVAGVVEAIQSAVENNHTKVVYVSNMMTQPGETDHFTLKNHLDAIEYYLGKGFIHHIIVNAETIPIEILKMYEEDGCIQVINDLEASECFKIITNSLVQISHEKKYIRHDPEALARIIVTLQ